MNFASAGNTSKFYYRMYYWFQRWKRRILLTLAIVGPGLITAFADNDAAGVATYTIAAATFGYGMLIILIPITILLAVTQEIGARIAIVAEKGLADLIRERFGIKIALTIYGILFLVNLAVVAQDVAGIGAALGLFGINPTVFLPPIIVGMFLFVVLARYNVIERFFFVLMGFYVTYIASAFLAKPDWTTAGASLVLPSASMDFKFLYIAIAVLGTTVTAWGQFFINSYVKDKRITTEHLKYNRAEIYIAAVLTTAIAFFMMVAVAATLYAYHIPVTDAADAALAIAPLVGPYATLLFGIGLLGAGMLGCVVVALSTAYAFSEFFGYSGSLDENFQRSRLFYITLMIQLALGMGIAMIPGLSLFNITLAGNFLNGIILPVLFYFLYQFANAESIMGRYTNSSWQNVLLVGSAALISFAAIFGVVGQVAGW